MIKVAINIGHRQIVSEKDLLTVTSQRAGGRNRKGLGFPRLVDSSSCTTQDSQFWESEDSLLISKGLICKVLV